MRLRISIMWVIILSLSASSQPRVQWLRLIGELENAHPAFYDIYNMGDDGLAICGKQTGRFWFVRTAEDGNPVLSRMYGGEDDVSLALSIIETENGGFLMGGHSNGRAGSSDVAAALVDAEGDEQWFRIYGPEPAISRCDAVIELKSGEFLLAGRVRFTENRNTDAILIMIDGDGDVLWEATYGDVGSYEAFKSLRETEGGIVLAGSIANGDHTDFWAVKVDFEGEVIWENHYGNANQREICIDMTSCDDGFALGGYRGYFNEGTSQYTLKIDEEGGLIWDAEFDLIEGDYVERCTNVARMPDNGLIYAGLVMGPNPHEEALTIRVNADGEEQWHRIDEFEDNPEAQVTAGFQAVIASEDGHIIAAGYKNRLADDRFEDKGLVVKMLSDRSEPTILERTPVPDEIDVLIGDSVYFAVNAIDLQEDELFYRWIFGEDTIATDSSVVIHFDELGEFIVRCFVSDGDLETGTAWMVHVKEWYIDSYSPDSLAWTVRRPHEVDFSLGVRAIEDVEPNFRWILTDREQRENDIGNEAELNYTFDIQGNYNLEGRAFHENTEQSVHWQVAVNSVLYWWRPHERQFEVERRQQIEFSVMPFNPDSDSLDYLWLIDGEDDGDVDDGIYHTFFELGEHTVIAIVHDGAEVDTVVWMISVVEPNGVEEDQASLTPTVVTLYPAAPNPFNSTTSIRYFLPRSADVRLTVYNSAGRLVQTLNEGISIAGEHIATMHGSELSAGVYLLRLETGDVVRSMKVVLLK